MVAPGSRRQKMGLTKAGKRKHALFPDGKSGSAACVYQLTIKFNGYFSLQLNFSYKNTKGLAVKTASPHNTCRLLEFDLGASVFQ